MKPKLIEVGFLYRGSPYVFRAFDTAPSAFYCEPGSLFKKVSLYERLELECIIEPASSEASVSAILGKIEAHWSRQEQRLLDAVPDERFIYQPEQGAEQEELFNNLLKTCEECIKQAIYFERRAREDATPIPAHRKHLS